ncbi:hypothetical protein IFM89_033576 [Coptis chinensis]|uniref:Uncharacterized protein n=1 Tax=Coptis chinensis TaxID=261450 RepID=A0A835M091_9MAGN|nr:hypothetical protein IFM89_033576 [Coptis chinensis]
MYHNFKKTFRGELWENLAWGAAEAYKVQEFTRILGVINKIDSKALDWLDREPRSCWARAHFDWTAKCDQLTNNFSEYFNSWILHIRDKLYVCFIDQYNLDLLNLMYTRRELSMELLEGDDVPNVLFMIKKKDIRYNWYECKMKQHLDIKYQCNNKKPQCNNNLQVPSARAAQQQQEQVQEQAAAPVQRGRRGSRGKARGGRTSQQQQELVQEQVAAPVQRGRGGIRNMGGRGARTRGEIGVRGGRETPSTPPRNARSKALENSKAALEKSKATLEKSKTALEKSKTTLLEKNKKAAIRVVVQGLRVASA